MRGPRLALALGAIAAIVPVPLLALPPQPGVGFVSPLPSVSLPLPSLPLPSAPLPTPTRPLPSLSPQGLPSVSLPLPSVSLPLPSVSPLPSVPLPSLSLPVPTPSLPLPSLSPQGLPTPPIEVGPSESGSAASQSGSPRATPGASAASQSPGAAGPGGGPGADAGGTAAAPTDDFLGIGLPAVAIGMPLLLALGILAAQLVGGIAVLPFVRRVLGSVGLRRFVAAGDATDLPASVAASDPPGRPG